MDYHKLKEGNFTGNTLDAQVLDKYLVSVTEHIPNVQVPKHAHEHSYISLVLHGFYKEQSNLAEQNLISGASLFRRHDYEHKNEIGPTKSLCFNLEIKKDFFNNEYTTIHDPCFKFEHNSIEVLNMYLGYKRNFSKELLSLTIDENAYLLFSRGKINTRTEHTVWDHKIKKQVRFHPEQKYTIDQVANALHMHPVYFVRKFKALNGITFGEFLIRQRLIKAIDLIHYSKYNLTEIAIESGFYDQSHFIKRFKEAFHITPRHYMEITKS